MTGAVVPDGTERIVIQEMAEVTGAQVRFKAPLYGKPHIRKMGEDVTKGAMVLKTGTRLDAGHLALLIALGITSIPVHDKPRMALLSTGDELVDGSRELVPGEIYDTNRPLLSILLARAGASVTDLGIVRDDPDLIVAALISAAPEHDFIISSGGASAGFADHLADAVRRRGYLEFWKLNMRPGKPIGFGDIDDCPILLLPGNPVAAVSGFAIIGRFVINLLQGYAGEHHRLRLPIADRRIKVSGIVQVLMGRYRHDASTGALQVIPLAIQGSASLSALAETEVLIVLSPDLTEIETGSTVDVLDIWR